MTNLGANRVKQNDSCDLACDGFEASLRLGSALRGCLAPQSPTLHSKPKNAPLLTKSLSFADCKCLYSGLRSDGKVPIHPEKRRYVLHLGELDLSKSVTEMAKTAAYKKMLVLISPWQAVAARTPSC